MLQTTFTLSTTLAVYDGPELIAVIVYSGFDKQNLEISVASIRTRWLNKEILCVAFLYPFFQLDVKRITARVREDNHKSLRFVEKLGFIREGCLRKAWDDMDVHIFGMLKNECRFLK